MGKKNKIVHKEKELKCQEIGFQFEYLRVSESIFIFNICYLAIIAQNGERIETRGKIKRIYRLIEI